MRNLWHLALGAVVLLGLTGSAAAQPYPYPITITTSSAQILAANTARKKLIFHNPNDTVKVAVCPAGISKAATGQPSAGVTITAVINGAGCFTILPYDRVEITGSTASGPQQAMPSAWIGIGSSSGALTIYEFE